MNERKPVVFELFSSWVIDEWNRTKPKTNRVHDKWHPQKFLIDRSFESIWRMASIKLTGQNRRKRNESVWLRTFGIFVRKYHIYFHTFGQPSQMSSDFSFFQNQIWAHCSTVIWGESQKKNAIDRKSLQLKFPQLCEHNAFFLNRIL